MYVGYDCNGIVRVWGTTEKECELAREEYLNNKSKKSIESSNLKQIEENNENKIEENFIKNANK